MSTNIYSLRTSMSGRERGASQEFSPAMGSAFALIADRSIPKKAPPARFTLFTNATDPSGAAPPGFALKAEKKQLDAGAWSKHLFYAAIAAALLLHLAVLTPFFVQPAPAPADTLKELGMEDGKPEQLNISVISEADLKRLSSDPFRQEAVQSPAPENTPGPPPEPEAAPAPQEKPVKEAKAAEPPSGPEAPDKKTKTFDPAGYIAMASEEFSSQLKHELAAANRRSEQAQQARQSGNVRSLRPGAIHQGKSDEWERKVIWALSATKPMGNGKYGNAIVTFAVDEGGQLQGLRLMKSSGDNWLDQGALLGVRQARMPTPPPGLPSGDRTFVIEYISLPH